MQNDSLGPILSLSSDELLTLPERSESDWTYPVL
jgi:hypothetical protein